MTVRMLIVLAGVAALTGCGQGSAPTDAESRASQPTGQVLSEVVASKAAAGQPMKIKQIGEPSMAVSTGLAEPGQSLLYEVVTNGNTIQEEVLKIRFVAAQKTSQETLNKVGKWQYYDKDNNLHDYDAEKGIVVEKGRSQIRILFEVEADPLIDSTLAKKEAMVFDLFFDKSVNRTTPTVPLKFGFVVLDN